jgi:histidine triad (HIT) family protein
MNCVFCRIVAGELSCRKVLEDERLLAFHDIHPQAPVHVLVVPKRHVASLLDLQDADLAGSLLGAAAQVARQSNLGSGFRLICNVRADGGQEIDHLHLHVLGGKRLGRMLPRWI